MCVTEMSAMCQRCVINPSADDNFVQPSLVHCVVPQLASHFSYSIHHSAIQSLTQSQPLTHSHSINLKNHLLTATQSISQLLNHSQPLNHSFRLSITHSGFQSLTTTHSISQSLTHSHSINKSATQSLRQPLNHSQPLNH